MSNQNYTPANPVNGPNFEDIDWENPHWPNNLDEMRPAAVTYGYTYEDIPEALIKQLVSRCFAEITCPKCGNTCFYYMPYLAGHKRPYCQVDGCDTGFVLE